jgi:hypothetical protein
MCHLTLSGSVWHLAASFLEVTEAELVSAGLSSCPSPIVWRVVKEVFRLHALKQHRQSTHLPVLRKKLR